MADNIVGYLTVLGALAVAFITLFLPTRRRAADGLPPGPQPLPFIGNVHQIPFQHSERTFANWSTQYGDLIFVRMFSSPTLVLNSVEAARDLLDKRSNIYSGRPWSTIIGDLLGWGSSLPLFPLGDRLRKQRRWVHEFFYAKSALDAAEPTQMREAAILLSGLLDSPHHYEAHLKQYTRSTMLELIYGHTVTSPDDRYLQIADGALNGSNDVAGAGLDIVEILPILRHAPYWIFGRGIRELVENTQQMVQAVHTEPYKLVEAALASGGSKCSMVGSLIEEHTARGSLLEEKRDIMSAAAMSYLAGVDTTNVTLLTFVLAMVLNPRVLEKAQEEIDRVIGPDRLPTRDDREELPYLECVLNEIYRWHPPIPLGLAHKLDDDDSYRGYRIPKGTMVMANLWFMTRDTTLYGSDPEEFRPERFADLSPDEAKRIDPRIIVFGYGRRICPGRRFADSSVWLAIATILATFDIHKARDERGVRLSLWLSSRRVPSVILVNSSVVSLPGVSMPYSSYGTSLSSAIQGLVGTA